MNTFLDVAMKFSPILMIGLLLSFVFVAFARMRSSEVKALETLARMMATVGMYWLMLVMFAGAVKTIVELTSK